MRADLSFRELSQLTGRHVETLRVLARTRRLPGAYKLGGRWAISRQAADALRRVSPQYLELRALAVAGDAEALRGLQDAHKQRVRFVSREQADPPGGKGVGNGS